MVSLDDLRGLFQSELFYVCVKFGYGFWLAILKQTKQKISEKKDVPLDNHQIW